MGHSTLVQFFTYNIVGIVNTIAGFSIIFLLMFLGLNAIPSNIIGYASTLVSSQ